MSIPEAFVILYSCIQVGGTIIVQFAVLSFLTTKLVQKGFSERIDYCELANRLTSDTIIMSLLTDEVTKNSK
jgi:hypothetical protein